MLIVNGVIHLVIALVSVVLVSIVVVALFSSFWPNETRKLRRIVSSYGPCDSWSR